MATPSGPEQHSNPIGGLMSDLDGINFSTETKSSQPEV